jgi:CheY-like chemotaxis protein
METSRRASVILMAEDDEDDCVLVETALAESHLDYDLRCVGDGEEMMDYLQRRGNYTAVDAPRPDLILLDLNMPAKDGRTVLKELKEDLELMDIPVVVLTGSSNEVDREYCYALGVDYYFTKNAWLDSLVEIIKDSGQYWFDRMTGKMDEWASA